MTGSRGIAAWVENHLFAILAAGFAAYSAYLIGTTGTDHRLRNLEEDVAELQADFNEVHPRGDRVAHGGGK